MNDVVISKTNGGLGRRNPSGDMISGILTQGIAVAAGLQLDTVYRLKSIADALALGIDLAYDETNKILVFEHINEFFRANQDGDLYILVVGKAVALIDLVDPVQVGYAKKLLIEASGEIKQLGVCFNPTIEVVDFTTVDPLIAMAQTLVDSEYTAHRPVSIILEGRGYDITAPVDFRSKNAKDVSVMVGQSLSIANKTLAATEPYEKYAALGTALGVISKAAVNENIAWVQKFNLLGGSLTASGVSLVATSDVTDGVRDTLNDNGGVFFINHVGKAGIYFNDSHTCVEITSDYAYIENNRTIHKAVRSIRSVLLPRLNSPIFVDSETGQLSPEIIKSYEADGKKALEEMLKNNEVSSIGVFVDPEQNILASSELQVKFELVPTGTARKISVTIGFSNPF